MTGESSPPTAAIALRLFTPADVPLAMELKTIAGWNQTPADWQGYLTFEPAGCFVAEADGHPAGTVTTINYGGRFGWVGMVLVHPARRRFGIGTTLLRHAIDDLRQRGARCIKLDATPMGRKVYVPLGFVDEYEVTRFEGTAPAGDPATASGVQYFTDGDVADVAAFDAPLFGAPRPHVLRSLARRNPEWCFVLREEAAVTGAGSGRSAAPPRVRGYLIARAGHQAVQLGPWAALDAIGAEELLRAFLRRVTGRRVYVDVPHPNAAGLELMRKSGFTVQRGFTRMLLGENAHPGQPQHVFGTSGAEKG